MPLPRATSSISGVRSTPSIVTRPLLSPLPEGEGKLTFFWSAGVRAAPVRPFSHAPTRPVPQARPSICSAYDTAQTDHPSIYAGGHDGQRSAGADTRPGAAVDRGWLDRLADFRRRLARSCALCARRDPVAGTRRLHPHPAAHPPSALQPTP